MLDTKQSNPVTKFLKFKSAQKQFVYWDKDAKVEVPYKLEEFIPITQLTTLKGWDNKTDTGAWANEVNHKDGIITVRTKNGVLEEGTYQEIKEEMYARGIKYTASVYAWANGELINLQLTGSGLGDKDKAAADGWFSVNNESRIKFDGTKTLKRGSVSFSAAKFKVVPSVPKDEKDAQNAFESVLKPYLESYLAPKVAEDEKATADDFEFDKKVDDSDLPFNQS